MLVYGSGSERVHLYDPLTDTIRRTFMGECKAPTNMAVSQDGTTLALDCGKGITVWQGGGVTPTVAPMLTSVTSIQALHSGGRDGSLRLLDQEGRVWSWNPRTLRWTPSKAKGIGPTDVAAFSPDGSQLVVASTGGAVSLVDAQSGQVLQTWRHGSADSAMNGVTAVGFSRDGRTVATAGEDGRARLWDITPGARHRLASAELPVVLPASYCAAPSDSDCRTIIARRSGRGIPIWETSESQASAWERMPISRTLVISPDTRYMVLQAEDKRLCVSATATAQKVSCLPAGRSPENTWKMAIGGREPTFASWDETELRLWRLPDLAPMISVPVSRDIQSLAFSPNAPILAVADSPNQDQVTLWDVSGGDAKFLSYIASPQGKISQLAFSPDGSALWMASGDRTSTLITPWQTATWQKSPGWSLPVDTPITALAVSPQGDRLAAGGEDGMIYLWDATTGNEIVRLEANGVTALGFNRDGRVLFSAGGRDSAIRIWPVDLQDLRKQASALISREQPQFTGAERRRFGLK